MGRNQQILDKEKHDKKIKYNIETCSAEIEQMLFTTIEQNPRFRKFSIMFVYKYLCHFI